MKNQALEEDVLEFLSSLKMAMFKLNGDTIQNEEQNHWTLQKESESVKNIQQRKMNNLCEII